MLTVGVIHATIGAAQPLVDAFRDIAPEVKVLNFVNDDLLNRANRMNGADKVGLRNFTQNVFQAADAGVDGIIIGCTVYTPYVSLMQQFLDIPIIAVDSPMIQYAIANGKKIGIIATTASTGPATAKKLQAEAKIQGKEITMDCEIVTDGMIALKSGDIEKHNAIVKAAGERLVKKGCDVILLTQITMACALKEMQDLDAIVLSSPEEGAKEMLKRIKK